MAKYTAKHVGTTQHYKLEKKKDPIWPKILFVLFILAIFGSFFDEDKPDKTGQAEQLHHNKS